MAELTQKEIGTLIMVCECFELENRSDKSMAKLGILKDVSRTRKALEKMVKEKL
jgi:hypothetical protein